MAVARPTAIACVMVTREILKGLVKLLRSSVFRRRNGYLRMKKSDSVATEKSLPGDVPRGHCAVYVGSQRLRFVIPATYLNHDLFKDLLSKAADEFGYDHGRGLVLPCSEVDFQDLTEMLERRRKRSCYRNNQGSFCQLVLRILKHCH